MVDEIKSMGLFFIDNKLAWAEGAELLKDIVIWEDRGKYPTFVPVCFARHPNYDGIVVVMAGNRGLIVSFCPQAKDMEDVRKMLSMRNSPIVQYRVAIDSIIHRLMIYMAEKQAEVPPFPNKDESTGIETKSSQRP